MTHSHFHFYFSPPFWVKISPNPSPNALFHTLFGSICSDEVELDEDDREPLHGDAVDDQDGGDEDEDEEEGTASNFFHPFVKCMWLFARGSIFQFYGE